jgi:hypothetical protein
MPLVVLAVDIRAQVGPLQQQFRWAGTQRQVMAVLVETQHQPQRILVLAEAAQEVNKALRLLAAQAAVVL